MATAAFTTAAFATETPREPQLVSISATDPHVASMGRTEKNADGSVRFGYPGVTLSVNFDGKTLAIDTFASMDRSYLEVIVDNGDPKVIKLTPALQSIQVVNEPTRKKHRVDIIHRSETWHGVVTIKQFSTDGKFTAAATLPKRKIMVLGDSVTCGEAIERIAGGTKETRWWNPRLSYGLLTAKALNAQASLVCYGGRGLIRSWNGKTGEQNLPDFYELAIAADDKQSPWEHNLYQPDVIISAIGTNDFGVDMPDRETYVTAYLKLVSTLLANHKHAQILLTEGAILSGDKKAALIDYIAEVVKRTNDKRVHSATSTHYPGDKTDSHPTKEQHAAMANDLAPQIKTLMQW
jgi:lysophospholipase L1-like esterase